MLNLTPAQKAIVCAIVDAHLPRQRVRVFGSRAGSKAGTANKPFSDLDLLILGAALDSSLRGMLEEAFDESDLPFRVDMVEVAEVANVSPDFLARIQLQAVALE